MKRFILLIIIITLLLGTYNVVMAQIYPQGDSFAKTDSWYFIEPKDPYIEVHYHNIDRNPSYSIFGVEYYRNEQTFFNVNFTDNLGTSQNYISGSYKFNNNFFLGGSSYDDSNNTYLVIAPGYSFNLGGSSFLAVSFDYLSTSNAFVDDGIQDYDFYSKYYIKNTAKFSGELYIPKEGENSWWIGAETKVADPLVVGAHIDADDYYHAGFTYKPSRFIIDGEIGKTLLDTYYNIKDNYIALSGMMEADKSLYIGAEYIKYQDYQPDAAIRFKAKYTADKSNFVLKYQVKNDSWYSFLSMAFEQTF